MFSARHITLGLAALCTAACAESTTAPAGDLTARFAHESNNKGTLSGMQDGRSLSGSAIINYVAGTEGWRSTVNVVGVLSPDTYTFFATGGPGVLQAVCSFTVTSSGGRQGCSADTDLAGFAAVEVRDSAGNTVVSGTFERRGGNREK